MSYSTPAEEVGVPLFPLAAGVQCSYGVDRARMGLGEKEGTQAAPGGVEPVGVTPEA